MGQSEVLDFLKDHPGEWFSSLDIATTLGKSVSTTSHNLRKLRNHHYLEPLFRMRKHKREDSHNIMQYSALEEKDA